jgi:hypothetical protein
MVGPALCPDLAALDPAVPPHAQTSEIALLCNIPLASVGLVNVGLTRNDAVDCRGVLNRSLNEGTGARYTQ